MARDQSAIGWDPSRRPASLVQSKASVTESSGLEQGCPGTRPEGAQTHQRTVFLSTQRRMPCPLTCDPGAHSQRVHTHTHGPIGPSTTCCVCSPGRHLSRHLLHPSRNLSGQELSSGERRGRAEGRGQQSPAGQLCWGPSGCRTSSPIPAQEGVRGAGEAHTASYAVGSAPSQRPAAGRDISLETSGAAHNSRCPEP